MDLSTFTLGAQVTPAHDATITSISVVPSTVSGAQSGEVMISTSNDGTCKVWDWRAPMEPVVTVKLSNDSRDAPVYAACVSETGTCAAACDTAISLFPFGNWGKYFEYTESHFEQINTLRFLGPTTLASGGEDGLVNLYNVTDLVNEDNGQCPFLTMNTGNSVRSIHPEQTRNSLVVFSGTESISSFDATTGAKNMDDNDSIRCHPVLTGSDELMGWGYLVGYNSGRVLAGNSAGVLAEFDLASNQMVSQFGSSHNTVVRSAVYLPDGRLITAGEDGMVMEWTSGSQYAESNAHHHSRPNRVSGSSRPY
jgi:WD40 repeat protein